MKRNHRSCLGFWVQSTWNLLWSGTKCSGQICRALPLMQSPVLPAAYRKVDQKPGCLGNPSCKCLWPPPSFSYSACLGLDVQIYQPSRLIHAEMLAASLSTWSFHWSSELQDGPGKQLDFERKDAACSYSRTQSPIPSPVPTMPRSGTWDGQQTILTFLPSWRRPVCILPLVCILLDNHASNHPVVVFVSFLVGCGHGATFIHDNVSTLDSKCSI